MDSREMPKTEPMPPEMAAPIWTMGPSAPAAPPVPMVIALVRIFQRAARANEAAAADDGLHDVDDAVAFAGADDDVADDADQQSADGGPDHQENHPFAVEGMFADMAVKLVADQIDQFVECDGRGGGDHADEHGHDQQKAAGAEAHALQRAVGEHLNSRAGIADHSGHRVKIASAAEATQLRGRRGTRKV